MQLRQRHAVEGGGLLDRNLRHQLIDVDEGGFSGGKTEESDAIDNMLDRHKPRHKAIDSIDATCKKCRRTAQAQKH